MKPFMTKKLLLAATLLLLMMGNAEAQWKTIARQKFNGPTGILGDHFESGYPIAELSDDQLWQGRLTPDYWSTQMTYGLGRREFEIREKPDYPDFPDNLRGDGNCLKFDATCNQCGSDNGSPYVAGVLWSPKLDVSCMDQVRITIVKAQSNEAPNVRDYVSVWEHYTGSNLTGGAQVGEMERVCLNGKRWHTYTFTRDVDSCWDTYRLRFNFAKAQNTNQHDGRNMFIDDIEIEGHYYEDLGVSIPTIYYGQTNAKINFSHCNNYQVKLNGSWTYVNKNWVIPGVITEGKTYECRGWQLYWKNHSVDHSRERNKDVTITPQYPYTINTPSIAQNEANGNVTLSWSVNNSNIPSTYQFNGDYTKFLVQVKNHRNNVIYSTYKTWDKNTTNYSIDIPQSKLGTATISQSYTFIVSQNKFPDNKKRRSRNINTRPKEIASTSIVADTSSANPQAIIRWTMTDGGYTLNHNYTLIVKDGITELPSEIRDGKILVSLTVCRHYPDLKLELRYPDYNDGNLYQTIDVPDFLMPDMDKRDIRDLVCSKGYFTDRVELSWKKEGGFTSFIIERSVYGDTANAPVVLSEIPVSTSTNYFYVDNNAQLGVYYQYAVKGIVQCGDTSGTGMAVTGLGFSRAYAVVSGNVSYGSGQAVKGVAISALTDNQEVLKNHALYFPPNQNSAIDVPATALSDINQFSFQAHIKPKRDSLDVTGSKLLSYINNGKGCTIGMDANGFVEVKRYMSSTDFMTVTSKTAIPTDEYTALAVTCSANQDSSTVAIYLNGKQDTAVTVAFPSIAAGTSTDTLKIGGTGGMVGYIDEIRIWEKALTAEEVAYNWNTYLNGNENGLSVYYRCDEPLNAGISQLFDLSVRESVFNKRNAPITGDGFRRVSDDVPPVEILAHKAYTDSTGFYLMKTMPYTTAGVSYQLVPSLGVHWFNPNQRSFYVSPQANIFNNVDFTDESSFDVSGTIYFSNTDYPVEECEFYIDGQLVSVDGEVVKSDAQGKYTISVPIGKHNLQVRKNGHTFELDGRFPEDTDPTNAFSKYNFQDAIRDVNFYDNTTVTMIGRVCGGAIQSAPVVGFGKSKANIGKAYITLGLQTETEYNLNTKDTTHYYEAIKTKPKWDSITVQHLVDGDSVETVIWGMVPPDTVIHSKAYIAPGDNQIFIETDFVTGEFIVNIPPIPFKIDSLRTASADKTDLGIENIAPFTLDPLAVMYNNDTLPDGTIDSIAYCKELKITYYNPFPSFSVKQVDAVYPGFFGDSVFVYADETTDSLSIPLYKMNGRDTMVFGYPIFTQKTEYDFEFQGFETYLNRDSNPAVIDTVPLQDVVVTVANEIGRLRAAIDTLQSDSVALEENQLMLDDEGKAIYSFMAGLPNIAGDYTSGLNISYSQNGAVYQWEQNGNFRGYVLGILPKGNNFVTAGPDMITTIIRDPGGSGSSSYMSENTTVSSSKSISSTYHNETNINTILHLGLETTVVAGLGVAVMTTVEVENDFTTGIVFEHNYEKNTMTNTIRTTTHKISTSSSSDYVGANGDVFVGTATNTIVGGATNIGIRKIEGTDFNPDDPLSNLKITSKDIIVMDMEFETVFNYTQNHIANTLIPEFERLRNDKLIVIREGLYDSILSGAAIINFASSQKDPVYYTALPRDHEHFGTNNNDTAVWGNQAIPFGIRHSLEYIAYYGPSYIMLLPNTDSTCADEILYFNNQIKGWENALAKNEMAKVLTFAKADSLLINNYSFDAGAILEHSTSVCSGTTHSTTKQFSGGYVLSNDLGFAVNKLGFNLEIEEINTGGTISIDETGVDTCTEYGFILTDEQFDDYLSVDVYNAIDGFGPVFRTRGGATSCPYEAGSTTQYYEPGTALDAPTAQVEKPQISTANPFVSGIPNGSDALYTIQLSNISDIPGNVNWYTIRVLDETNPDGAIILMDGSPLTGSTFGREIYVTQSQTINKTIVLRQSDLSVTHYEIQIALMSSCQNDVISNFPVIADTLTIQADFVPACTDIQLQIPDRIVNSETGDTLSLSISGYDKNYNSFADILLQYKGVNENDWTLVREFANVPHTVYPGIVPMDPNNCEQIDDRSSISYKFGMRDLTDTKYQIRAITRCRLGNDWVIGESNTIEVTKDTKRPEVFGYPQPSDGILSAGDEVSITFNENINSNILYEGNFSVKGVLNGAESRNSVGLSFNGAGNAHTELPVHLENTSFTIEAWVKHTPGTSGTLFSVGEGDKILSFGFNSDNTVFAKYDSVTRTSTALADYNEWQYITFSIKRLDSICQVTSRTRYDDTEIVLFAATDLSRNIENDGQLFIGSQPDGSDGFTGLVRDVQIWNYVRGSTEVSLTMNINKSGNEAGLLGYWPMDEVTGTIASDKARSRHLTVNTDWHYPDGKSLSLNNSPVMFNSNDININSTKDYSVEFWFNGASQNATLFSCGHGIGDLSGTEVSDKLSVAMTDQGTLILRTNGNQYPVATNIGDNVWHHFALTMKRNSQTIVYVDGNQKMNTTSNNVGALAADKICLGGCYYRPNVLEPNNFVTTELFTGLLDEVRIWNCFLPLDVVKQNKNTNLTGSETGLLAYYPFEAYDYTQTPPTVTPDTTSGVAATGPRRLNGMVMFSDEIPAIKSARFEENVLYNWTASDNKIVFTLTEQVKDMEKCFLNFNVKKVEDVNGNVMSSPATWTVYVNLNTLKWTEEQIEIEKEVDESYTFTTTISNTGSTVEYYNISQLPPWLSVSSYQGTINPLSTQEITFIINDAVAIGKYEASIALSGNNNYNEVLNLSLNVTGNRPIWEVNPSAFTSSMNVIGQIKIQEEYQRDPEDIVAAFYGQLCLGVAQPQYMMGQYYVFMDIYGDSTVNLKRLTFKYWDASTGTVYARINVTPTINYQADAVYGTVAEPVVFRVTADVTQTYALQQGWNWISTNIESTPNSLSDLQDGLGTYGVMIKSQNEFLQSMYDPSIGYVWVGNENFTNISNEAMYMIQTNQSCGLELSGSLAAPADHSITLYSGWTWIGYVPFATMSINDALAGIEPQVNDVVKTQRGFSTYLGSGIGWVGSLTALRPGIGYMYKSLNANAITFNYPTPRSGGEEVIDWLAEDETNTFWQPNPYLYSGNMTMTAVVEIDSVEQYNGDLELGAFVDNECRGAIQLTYVEALGRYIAFLTVYGDVPENVEFRLYNHATGTPMMCAVSPSVLFEQNAVYGNPQAPYVASFISVFHTAVSATICEGETYTANGFNVTTAGTHVLNMTAQNGADSIVTLTLTVNPTYETTFEATLCAGENYTEHGFALMNLETGVYTETLQQTTQQGCDSTFIVTLTVHPTYEMPIAAAICEGESYTENGFSVIQPEAGIITETRHETTYMGCDSLIVLTLTVQDLPIVVVEGESEIESGESVTLTATGAATYLWSTGATTAQITVSPTTDTTYTVVGTDENGCVSEEVSKTISIVLAVSDVNEIVFNIYPNPADAIVTVEGENMSNINVYNIVGQLVETITDVRNGHAEIKTSHLESGVYIFRITTTFGHTATKRVVITH